MTHRPPSPLPAAQPKKGPASAWEALIGGLIAGASGGVISGAFALIIQLSSPTSAPSAHGGQLLLEPAVVVSSFLGLIGCTALGGFLGGSLGGATGFLLGGRVRTRVAGIAAVTLGAASGAAVTWSLMHQTNLGAAIAGGIFAGLGGMIGGGFGAAAAE